MRQAQINVRTRACSRTSIARTKQAALTHNVRGKELMIIIKIIILYFIQIRHTDDFPPTGTPASYFKALNTDIVFNVLYIHFYFYIMYYIHIVKRFRAHCGFYAIEK